MKVETVIKNEAKKYKGKAITNKSKGVNLDKLEIMLRKHENVCHDYISKQDLPYAEECKYRNMASEALEQVDKELFGCFNDKGLCLGYNFHG